MADAVRAVTTELFLVSNVPGASAWLADAPAIPDVRSERSSLTGIHTALVHASAPVLVVAWDMPFLSAELLHLIVDAGTRARYAAVPEGPAGDEPMCAVYHPAALTVVDAALDANDFKLTNLIARLPAVERIPRDAIARLGDPERFFFNVNDVQNLEMAQRMAEA